MIRSTLSLVLIVLILAVILVAIVLVALILAVVLVILVAVVVLLLMSDASFPKCYADSISRNMLSIQKNKKIFSKST